MLEILLAFVLTYALGFERQVRGAPAGERTFALIGVGTAVIGELSARDAPNALAGAVTGIGFIGGGVLFHQGNAGREIFHGVTTAAAIFAAAAIGAAAGEGRPGIACLVTGLCLLALEIRHTPFLRWLDAVHWASRFRKDFEHPAHPPGTDV